MCTMSKSSSAGRTPQGVRGLKPVAKVCPCIVLMSHSARSAWIETTSLTLNNYAALVALRKECVD